MAKIGEYRLEVYELFYKKPVCEYAEIIEGKKIQNVLILGNGWAGNEAFKAAFWAGQSLDSELNITVASNNAEKYKKQVLSEETKAYLPALKLYAEEKKYANLHFANVDVNSELDEAGLSVLDFENKRYNYVIVCLGDAELNWLATSELISHMAGISGKVIINVFNEFSDSVAAADRELLISQGKESGIDIHFWGEDTAAESELKRIACNINFAYGMKYDQRVSNKLMAEQFERSMVAEFVESPTDYKGSDMEIVSNFIGSKYVADSSLASAVHIPVKLALCKETNPETDALSTLKEAIRSKNDLYRKLVSLEHRRWNAYMVMRGFRAPSKKEEETLLYRDGNNHQDTKRLLHICLCDCGQSSGLEQDFDGQYQQWIKKKCPANAPSELDRASLRVHQITSHLSRGIDTEKTIRMIVGDNEEYIDFRRSIIKLKNDEENSLPLYLKSLGKALQYAETISEEDVKLIKSVDALLLPVKVRNARTDFFALDRQLVDMLPFVLWYGEKYGTVITISEGMATASSDVIVPTMFCAKKAVFIGRDVKSAKYQEIIETYFQERGANTEAEFLQIQSMDVESVYRCIEEQVQKYGYEDLVINCVPHKGYESILAIGKLMEKYQGQLNVVQYLSDKGLVSFSTDKNIGVGLENKSFSFAEYIHLMGGRFANEYEELYDTSQYDSFLDLFSSYSTPLMVKNGSGGEKKINPWIEMNKFFTNACKDQAIEKNILAVQPETEVRHYRGVFAEKIYTGNRIGKTLRNLEEYRVIRNYEYQICGNEVNVEFDYVDTEICEVFQMFEKGKITYENAFKNLKFMATKDGLKISDCRIQEQKLFDVEEPEKLIRMKKSFLHELERKGFISKLVIDKNGYASFIFKDEPTMRILKNQGTLLELIVYHLMSESCLFDDVKTGVKVVWDADEISVEKRLKDRLESMDSSEFGYEIYVSARKKVNGMNYTKQGQLVRNEIDVIAIKGMNAIMVSCKTAENANVQWIYEIKSVAEHFQASGVMALSTKCNESNRLGFMERGEKMGIPIWGSEILWDDTERKKAFEALVKQFA